MENNKIEKDLSKILVVLFENGIDNGQGITGSQIAGYTKLNPEEINCVIDLLDNRGMIERQNYMGTAPYNFGTVFLNSEGKYFYSGLLQKSNMSNINQMKIFISHSHKDLEIAKSLIELLRSSLNIASKEIRCTSVDGYRLPAGISTDDQLKTEIHDSEVLIGLISPSSISSYYVLFELGARWGANKPLIPLITNEKSSDLLKGPLQGINALNIKSESQLYQLISDLAKLLSIEPEPPNSYQSYIKKLSKYSIESDQNSTIDQIIEKVDNFDYSDSDESIKQYCKDYWPDDFSMQLSCINEQKEAVEILKKGRPSDISEDDFVMIRKKAAEDWPDDYSMRVSQEQEQFEALRKLKDI